MDNWDVYCNICGGPIHNKFLEGREVYNPINGDTYMVDKTKTEYNWLFNIILLSSTGKIIKTNGKYYDGSGNIKVKNKTFVITPSNYHLKTYKDASYGIVCHQDCYKLLQIKFKFNLEFANVCRILDNTYGLIKSMSKYGIMQRYATEQSFEFHLAHIENDWLLKTPILNNKNKSRVLKMWKPLIQKFREYPPRAAPCESALKFNISTKLKGYDGKMWIVKKSGKTKKWVRDSDEFKRKSSKPFKRRSRKPSKRKSRKPSKKRSRKPSKRRSRKLY